MKDYDQAVKLDPTSPVHFYERGRAWVELKDYTAAMRDFDQAIEIDPRYGEAYFQRGKCLWLLGKREQADRDFAAAARLSEKTVAWIKSFRASQARE